MPLFVGLRQSRRRISVRSVLGFCERSHHRRLAISAHICSASSGCLHCAPFCFVTGRVFARARSPIFSSLVVLCCVCRFFDWLYLLFVRLRLFRRVWCL